VLGQNHIYPCSYIECGEVCLSTMPEEQWMRWVEPLDNLVFQAWYRVLSFVSIHAPIEEVFQAAQYIAQNRTSLFDPPRGGDVFWVVPGFVARWENLDVNPPHGVKITIWMSGNSKGKNTVLSRVGWWTLYLFDTAKRVQRFFGA